MGVPLIIFNVMARQLSGDTVLHTGTTQVLLISERAVALASDTVQHGSNTGRESQHRHKVDAIGSRLVVGVSGTCAFVSGDRKVSIDLQDPVPPLAAKLDWQRPDQDAAILEKSIRRELALLERQVLPGTPDPDLIPQVTVLLGAVSNSIGVFAIRFRYPGKYIAAGTNYRMTFEQGRKDFLKPKPGKFIVLIETHRKDVELAARDLIAGRSPVDQRYASLRRLHQADAQLDQPTLERAASDLVKVTMDLDPYIAGDVDVVSVGLK